MGVIVCLGLTFRLSSHPGVVLVQLFCAAVWLVLICRYVRLLDRRWRRCQPSLHGLWRFGAGQSLGKSIFYLLVLSSTSKTVTIISFEESIEK